ncbi:hypothetical protein B0H17DRAFT_1214790 [Mycena rosella]|uniref:Uncharacterized protein n=1 Tax=Mycena rosella TaxID=1033263 RepID=A0AAD7CM37_MYCRO|nr:hypothetical protein B0H17DRAFT_1214790 [Mycena rosella]
MPTLRTDCISPPGYSENPQEPKKNGTEHARPVQPKGHQDTPYVSYCVYGLDGPISPKGVFGGSNPLIGRIKATSVPPPHTVDSLKRALVQAEGLPDPVGALTSIYQIMDARIAMVAGARVAILAGEIGAMPQTPLALVFLAEQPNAAAHVSTTSDDIVTGEPPRWLYYRLYTRGGEAPSTLSLDAAEPGLGRVKRDFIAPPRNASTIRRRIAKIEGTASYAFADLFTDMSADRAHVSDGFVADTCGATENDPVLIVQPERRAGLYNRPLFILSQYQSLRYSSWNQVWLSPAKGEIVYTDGIKDKSYLYVVYTAIDRNGRKGLVIGDSTYAKFLDEDSSSSSSSSSWECSIQ